MKLGITYFIVLISLYSCNTPSTIEKTDVIKTPQKLNEDTAAQLNKAQIECTKDTLVGTYDLNTFIQKNIKHVKPGTKKHFDWMSNRASRSHCNLLLPPLSTSEQTVEVINKRITQFKINTKSYLFKEKCLFYIHELSHTNDSLSMKPFLENIQGKISMNYMSERVMLFTMKDDKKANFIDIPANWNHLEIKDELLATVKESINSDVMLCHRMKECKYVDLRK